MNYQVHRGTESELLAQVWLARKGYYIFKNVDNTCPIDIVAIKDKEILLIDVKTTRKHDHKKYETKSKALTPTQKKLGVKLLYVYENGDCKF